MTGKQLKILMEWAAGYYKQSKPGDLTVAFNEDRAIFNFITFTGVNYEVNISKPAGERIENLTWSDGRPVKDNDMFKVVVHDYFVNTYLSSPGDVYKDTDTLPELITADASGGIGNQRDVIIDYIANVKNGEVSPIIDNNWKLTGINTDEETIKKISKLVEEGKLKIESSKDGRKINFKAITQEMLDAVK